MLANLFVAFLQPLSFLLNTELVREKSEWIIEASDRDLYIFYHPTPLVCTLIQTPIALIFKARLHLRFLHFLLPFRAIFRVQRNHFKSHVQTSCNFSAIWAWSCCTKFSEKPYKFASSFKHVRNPCDIVATNCTQIAAGVLNCNLSATKVALKKCDKTFTWQNSHV